MLEGYVKDNHYAIFHMQLSILQRNALKFLTCSKSLTKSVECEMYVKSTGSWCMLEVYGVCQGQSLCNISLTAINTAEKHTLDLNL